MFIKISCPNMKKLCQLGLAFCLILAWGFGLSGIKTAQASFEPGGYGAGGTWPSWEAFRAFANVDGVAGDDYVMVPFGSTCHHVNLYGTDSHIQQSNIDCGGHGVAGAGSTFLADISGDGRVEYVTVSGNGCHHVTFYNLDGSVDLSKQQTDCVDENNNGMPNNGVANGLTGMIDVNGDGRQEYVTMSTSGYHYITFYHPDGTVDKNTTNSNGKGTHDGSRNWIDVDGDGRQEYVSISSDGQHHFTFYTPEGLVDHNIESGGGHYGPHNAQVPRYHFDNNSVLDPNGWIDVNGDGRQEFATMNRFGTHSFSFYHPDGTIDHSTSFSGGHGVGDKTVSYQDVNGDGRDEHVTSDGLGRHFFTFYTPDGQLESTQQTTGDIIAAFITFADLDGDGRAQYITVGGVGGGHYITTYPFIPPVDIIPPVVTPPTSITVLAVDGSGTPASNPLIQTFLSSATALDDVDGDVTALITHNASAQFPVGTTTVVFSASDAAGNIGTNQSTVTVYETLTLNPVLSTVEAGTGSVAFVGSGGIGSRTFSLTTNQSGGSIDVNTGVYTAGPNAGTDMVQVADAIANTATATVTVQDDSMIFIPLMHNGKFIPIFIP